VEKNLQFKNGYGTESEKQPESTEIFVDCELAGIIAPALTETQKIQLADMLGFLGHDGEVL